MLIGDSEHLPAPLAHLSTTGLLRHEPADALHDWIQACIAASLVKVSNDKFQTLSLTTDGRKAMQDRMPGLKLRRPVAVPLPLPKWDEDDYDLYFLRRQLRSRGFERYR